MQLRLFFQESQPRYFQKQNCDILQQLLPCQMHSFPDFWPVPIDQKKKNYPDLPVIDIQLRLNNFHELQPGIPMPVNTALLLLIHIRCK